MISTKVSEFIDEREGWAVLYLIVGNKVGLIRALQDHFKRDCETINNMVSLHAQLVGTIYLVVKRMKVYGYNQDAEKVQEILDVAADLDPRRKMEIDSVLVKMNEVMPDNTISLAGALLTIGTTRPK